MDIQYLLDSASVNNELSYHNKRNINKVRKILADNKMKYTESSVDYVLYSLNRSFEDTIEYSDENLLTLLICGISSHSREKALEIMGELRKDGISYREQHFILTYILKCDHFFMNSQSRSNYLNLIATLGNR
ncbi:MAG: hypothetical protein IJ593_07785 [Lachnospiraceae bacterium]|nr:hypothetical protein [Lachnospiraceae bacterium]